MPAKPRTDDAPQVEPDATSQGRKTTGTPLTFTPIALTSLTSGEVATAVQSGGLVGIMRAILGKVTGLDAATTNRAIGHSGSPSARAVESMLRSYRQGSGGADQADALAHVRASHVEAATLTLAIQHAAEWLAANPGTVVVDVNHTSGKRRTFP